MSSRNDRLRLLEADAALHPIRTRMPFRYGSACLTASPVLTVRLLVEDETGATATGLASDCLPPRWFDKDPTKEYAENVADQLRAFRGARDVWLGRSALATPFEHWRTAFDRIQSERGIASSPLHGLNALTASFGCSFLERAMLDALCRLRGLSFFDALAGNLLGCDTASHLPARPLERIACRHTVGLADPITRDAIPPADVLDDGLPQSLDECIDTYGLRYFKVKVSGDRESDLARLGAIAELLASRCAAGFAVSLDGNEQYRELSSLESLLEALRGRPEGDGFVESILYIEQPLARDVALDPSVARDVVRLGEFRPVVIDESDDLPDSFARALEVGYRGTSHKNCKGVFKSLHNHALARAENARRGREECFLTAEDLANTPTLPLQMDLCTLAALGIGHAERNGHHYFHGLDHLSPAEAAAAARAHPDLYETRGGSHFLTIRDGDIRCGSIQCPGYGYAGEVDFSWRRPLDDWDASELA